MCVCVCVCVCARACGEGGGERESACVRVWEHTGCRPVRRPRSRPQGSDVGSCCTPVPPPPQQQSAAVTPPHGVSDRGGKCRSIRCCRHRRRFSRGRRRRRAAGGNGVSGYQWHAPHVAGGKGGQATGIEHDQRGQREGHRGGLRGVNGEPDLKHRATVQNLPTQAEIRGR